MKARVSIVPAAETIFAAEVELVVLGTTPTRSISGGC